MAFQGAALSNSSTHSRIASFSAASQCIHQIMAASYERIENGETMHEALPNALLKHPVFCLSARQMF